MKDEFIPYEQALALKELGFREQCFGYYYEDGVLEETKIRKGSEKSFPLALAPLYQQAFRWFREECGLWVTITYDLDESENMFWYIDNAFKYGIGPLFFHDLGGFKSSEEAELACLDKLIEIVKNK